MIDQRILFVGTGKLGGQILDLLLRLPGNHQYLVGGRHLEAMQERAHLSQLVALQLGYHPEVRCCFLDLNQVEQTAETIAHFQPDILFCAATAQSLGGPEGVPLGLQSLLASAPLAPRLPFSLSLVYKIMQAVRLSGRLNETRIVNAIFPDMIHPILDKVGLAPTTGIGELANNIPALRQSLSQQLHRTYQDVEVRCVMARWISYWLSRKELIDSPMHCTVFVNGEDRTHQVNLPLAFEVVRTELKRTGGETGLLMTASSALIVCRAMMQSQKNLIHVPGPNGLPGGYPASIDSTGVDVLLPPGMSIEKARHINEEGLRLDGIGEITAEGTVIFTNEAVSLYEDLLGYSCDELKLAEVDERLNELQKKYKQYTKP